MCSFYYLPSLSKAKKKGTQYVAGNIYHNPLSFATDEPLYVVDVELCGYSASWAVLMLYRHLVD